ncbi:GNAT family N-acetyltransferase [Magnetofaba australis]|uniref:BioF2-like acetyltransferase domain-containing protein n=1 Tax=Magnetofaba australis IT-1 TaxID=1434232 RepID=A0A1Y2K2C9_9PROT|nr:GNAT family N-acetyltransferase [Magnetofaba australis]OSM02163.1 hypothetical protein MAIT1_02263 [Magnetofaba australis IT-1]
MHFVCYTDWAQLPASADALFAAGERQSLFLSRLWLEQHVTRLLADARQVRLACVLDGDTVRAILPLAEVQNNAWDALTSLYSGRYTLLLAPEDQEAVLKCLAQGLAAAKLVVLTLDLLDRHDPTTQALQAALEAAGFLCHPRFQHVNWIHPVGGQSFKQYMAGRPGRVRSTIARKGRKLARERKHQIRLYGSEELPEFLTHYHAIHRGSWKSREPLDDHLADMLDALASRGWLRAALLTIDGHAAAAQIWFIAHGRASIFRLVYDEAWREYSPGTLLTAYMMELAIDREGVMELDYLYGNDPYKQEWMSQRCERWILGCALASKPQGVWACLTSAASGWFSDVFSSR